MRPLGVRVRHVQRRAGPVASALAAILTATSSMAVATLATPPPVLAASPASTVSEFQPTVPTKYGGRSISVSVNASDPNDVIVATESGGLFLSGDDGANWSHVDSFPLHRMSDVRWSPNNPSLIVATTWTSNDTQNGGGVWRSTNAGATWSRATTPAGCGADFNGWGIDFEPSSTVVYAGSDCGLLLSTDGGATFTRQAIPGWTHAVVARQNRVDVCSDDGHRAYTRSGATLTLASGPNPFPAVGPGATAGGCPQVNGGVGASAHDLAGAPQEAGVLFVMKNGTSTTACGGSVATPAGVYFLFESDDSGANWTQIGGGCGSRAPWVQSFRSRNGNAADFDIYYSGGLDIYRATCTSGGPGLRCTSLPAIGSPNVTGGHADPSTVAFVSAGNCARFAVSDGGVEKSTDCGATFPMAAGSGAGNGNFNGLQVYEIAGQVHPGHSDYIFGTQDNSIYGSGDSGATWPNVHCCEGWNFSMLRSAPTETGRVTFTRCGACLNRQGSTHLTGVSNWPNPPGTQLGADVGTPYLLPPTTDTYVQWTGSGATNQLYLTTDAGGTWTAVSGATTNQALMGNIVVAGPASDPTLYQGVCVNGCGAIAPSGSLLKITGVNTGGTVTVTTVAGGLNTLGTYNYGNGSFEIQQPALGVDPNDPLHMIAADVGTNGMKETTDGGATWTTDAQLTSLVTANNRFAFNDGTGRLGTEAHAIYFDPTDASRILVGTEHAGIIASLDGGVTWTKLPGSDAIPAITSFFVDEVQGTILVTSYGRGLWKLSIPEADLSVTKSHHPDPAVAGTELYYDITVANGGPDDASVVTVTDQLPAEVTYVTNTLAAPATCAANTPPPGTGQTVTCQLGSLANGASRTFTIKVAVRSGAIAASGPRGITNTVSVSQLGAADPDASNNTADDTVIVEDSADLKVTKLCKPDTTVDAGQPIDCTVFVDNVGPSDARGVVVDDAMLSNGTFVVGNVVPALGSGTPGCTLGAITGGQQLTCRFGVIPAATDTAAGRATLTYRITATQGQDINNAASVRSATPDPDATNNAVTVALTVRSVADLALTVSAPGSATAGGGPVAWTFTVANGGPSIAENTRVEAQIPAGVHVVSVTGPGGTCVAGVPGDPFQPAECSFGDVPASGSTSRTMTVTVTVDPSTTGILHADGRASTATFDPDTANDLAHADITVTVNSNLSAAIVGSPDPVVAGRVLTFKATTTNLGPSTATGATLRVDLPAGVTYQGVSSSGPAACGLLTPTQLGCGLGTMAPGASTDVFVDMLVAPSVAHGATLTGTATVGSGSPDATPGNNTASDTVAVVRSADLAIVLVSEAVVYKPSKIIHYEWTVTNLGPSDAASVVVQQTLPPTKMATYNSNNGGCPAPTGSPPVLTCALGTVPAGGTVTVQVNVLIRGNKGTITSTAVVSSATADPVSANNTSIRNVTVK